MVSNTKIVSCDNENCAFPHCHEVVHSGMGILDYLGKRGWTFKETEVIEGYFITKMFFCPSCSRDKQQSVIQS